MKTILNSMAAVAVFFATFPTHAEDLKPIQIADVKHDGPVDFEKEILNKILRRNCVACHNATDAEGDLVLETPATILKGGSEGPSVVPGKGADSLLLKVAAYQSEPIMPPEDNDVGAKPLTPEQLGLIKLWIDQGAKGEVRGVADEVVFERLPAGVNPIYAAAISPDGQYVAAGRANQIFIYHAPSKREIGRLTDPALLQSGIYDNPGVAHLDLVQSLAFSPDNVTLASGGYKTVKLWRRARNEKVAELQGIDSPARSIAVGSDGKFAAIGQENGKIKIFDAATGKVAQTLEHSGAITGAAFSADGSKFVSGSQDKTFRLWNVADWKQIGEPVETPAPVNAVAIVGEDKLVATGNADNTIRTWVLPGTPAPAAEGAEAAEPPKPVKELKGHGGPVTSLAVVPTNTVQLLSGSQDATARVWDVNSGAAVRTLSHGGPVVSVAVRPDGQKFATASSNNIAKLWNAADGKQLAEMKGDFRATLAVGDMTRTVALAKRKIDDTKKDLDEANKRKTAEVANQKKAEEAKTKAEEEHKKKVEAATKPVADKEAADKEHEANTAALAKADEAKKAADAAATSTAEELKKAQATQTAANKAATDGASALTAAQGKLKAAQDAAKADPDNKEKAGAVVAAQKAVTDAEAAKKTADEAKVAADKAVADADTKKKAADEAKKVADIAFADATAKQKASDANVKKLAPVAQKAVDERTAAERALNAAKRTIERAIESVKKSTDAVPPIEALLKAAEESHKQKTAKLEVAKKTETETPKPLHAIAFSPDGSTLATSGDDQIVRTWDSEAGKAIETYVGQGAVITQLAFMSDGNILAIGQNNSAVVWNATAEFQIVKTIGTMDTGDLTDRVTSLAFSPDGKQLATGAGEPSRSGELKIWNVEDGSLIREIKEPHSDTIFAIEFSPSSEFLATCGADRFVKVFEVADGKFVKSFEGHTHHVLGVSWRADGRVLASSGADKVIKVWDFRTGDQIRTITGFKKELTSIQFIVSPDGNNILNLVASCGDKTVITRRSDNGGGGPTFSGGTDFMYCVDASGDGNTIVAGGQDSVLRIWQQNGTSLVTFAAPQPEETASTDGGG